MGMRRFVFGFLAHRLHELDGQLQGCGQPVALAVPVRTRPDVETAAGERRDLPCAPDAHSIPEAMVGDGMRSEISLGPPRLALGGVVASLHEERPDVVVIDVMMPRLDGLEAICRIKREWPNTKVLVLTHLTDADTRREAFEKGADAFLDKRDIASGLVPAIWDACEPGRPRRGSARRR